VLAHKRNDKLRRLQFNEEFSRWSSDFHESLNIVFQDLIEPHDSDEDIANEKSFRVEEAKKIRLEEEKMLQIVEVNKRKCLEFMNSTHVKNTLAKLTTSKRNDVHSFTGKTKPEESWVKIKNYCKNVNGQLQCKLPWSDDYTVYRKIWLKLVCLDPGRKGWLSEEHIDLKVHYMWHGRPKNANGAMVSCYFVQILLQNNMPLFYANGDKYATL
nr:phospholipase-like protein [Tanacetum cinerariifolium]